MRSETVDFHQHALVIGSYSFDAINKQDLSAFLSFSGHKWLVFIIACLVSLTNSSYAQNSFNSGDGWGAGWGIGAAFSASAGNSLIYTTTNSNGAGSRYFRFFGNGTPCGHYGPQNAADQQFNFNSTISGLICDNGQGAYWITVANTSYNYVFKSASVSGASVVCF